MLKSKDKSKIKKRIIILLAAILLFSAFVLFFNLDQLSHLPFVHETTMDEPIIAAMNEAGYSAVVDKMGTDTFILSPENEVLSEITYSFISDTTPKTSCHLAMDEEYLYILDGIPGENGTSYTSVRILVYDFQGRFKKVLINSEDFTEDTQTMYLVGVYAWNGRIFATMLNTEDESAAAVADITDGQLNIIHSFNTGAPEVFDVFYYPETDSTTAVTQQGDIYIWEGEREEIRQLQHTDYQLDDCYYIGDGRLIALDRNARTIAIYNSDMQCEQVLVQTDSYNFSICGDSIIYADYHNYTLHRLSLTDGAHTELSVLTYTITDILLGYVTWIFLLLGAASLIALVLIIIQTLIAARRRGKMDPQPEDASSVSRDTADKPMTTFGLYGPIFAMVIIGFIATAVIFSSFYYDEVSEEKRAAVANTGFILRGTSADSIGSNLVQINSQADYGSDAYLELESTVSTICMSNISYYAAYDLYCVIYRFSESSDDITVILDQFGQSRIGTIKTAQDQEIECILPGIEAAREGRIYEQRMDYANGTRYYVIYTPIMDSAGNVVGAVMPMMNETYMTSQIQKELMTKLLEIFTLLAGLAMLFGEAVYVKDIAAIRSKRRAEGILGKSVVEVSRSLMIVARLSFNVMSLFCSIFALEILESTGEEYSTILVAVPLTTYSVANACMRMTFPSIVKYRPKFYMLLDAALMIVGAIIFGLSSTFESYLMLIVSTLIFGIGSGMLITAIKAIQFAGIEPAPRYRLMVFCNGEDSVGSAIGVAMASVIRGIFGDTAMIIYMIFMAILVIPMTLLFIGDDIAVKKDSKKTGDVKAIKAKASKSLKAVAGDMLKFVRRPAVIIILALALLPDNFMMLFKSYVLPQLNNSYMLPSSLIGTITLGMQLVTLAIAPYIMKKVPMNPKLSLAALVLGILAVFQLLFAWDNTMKTFVILLIALAVSYPIVHSISDRIVISEAKKSGLVVNDAMMVFEIFNNIDCFTGPALMTLMMAGGISNLGWYWAGICGFCVIMIMLLKKRYNCQNYNYGL